MAVTSTGYRVGKQPLAQSFFVDELRGIYCTRIDLYFRIRSSVAHIPKRIDIVFPIVYDSSIILELFGAGRSSGDSESSIKKIIS